MRPGSPAEGTSSSRVELRLAGAFGVVLAGRELASGEVGSRKARTLLKLLAVERRGLLSADRIADVLWDAAGGPPAEPGQAVATLVSRLRAALGSGVIRGGRDGYRLAGEPEVGVDLDAAARYCEHAELRLPTVAAAALAAAGHAAELLAAGTALADEPYAAWADPARAELRALLRRVRLTAAQAALAVGDPDAAARYAEAAMTADPLDEAACRLSMSAAALAGEPARALLAYAALRDRLGEELGADPALQTRELHLAILRAQSAPGGTAPRTARGTSGDLAIPQRPRLAGRDAEIGVLREAWARAAAGEPSLVMITGEAGIGKTALAAYLEAEARQDGATVLRTRCYEAEQSLFLQPIVDAVTPAVSRMTGAALRDLLGEHASVLAALLPDAAAVLGPPPSWRGSPEMERRRSFEAVTAFLSGLAGRNPVLLVLDDLQYAGKSTVEFTHYLSRHLSGGWLLVVVTVRAEDHEQATAVLAPVSTRVELGPLDPAAVALLSREAGQEGLTETILRRTRGHTLFVVEVVRALAAGDAGVPESLRSAVQARMRRTGAAAESVLRAGAVLGAAFDPLVLAELLDLAHASVLDLCEQALQARLLIVSGRDYEFANDLIREVMYATTPEPARLAHHRRAADLLTSQPEVLARHASAAGDWPRAGWAWALAAEDAMRRYATSDAIALSAQALAAAERGGDEELRVRALVLRGCAHEAAGAYDAAFGDLTLGAAAARGVGDPRLELRAISELGRSRPWTVKAGAAAAPAVPGGAPIDYYMANLASGLRIAGSLGDRASEADLLSQMAVASANRLRLADALEYGTRAVSAARASGDEQALAAGLDGLKIACLNVGDLGGLAGVLVELRPLLRRLRDPYRLQWAEFESAYLFIAPGDLDKAAEAMRAGLEVNRRGGYPHFAAYYTAHLGWLARLRGDDKEAVALGRQAVDIADRHEHAWWQAVTCALLGSTLLLAGDRAAAIGLFELGLAAARDAGAEAYLLHCTARLAGAAGSPAVLADADRLLGQAGIPADTAWLLGEDAYLALAQAWLDRDEPERGRAVLAPLLALAERVPWTPTHAATLAADARALIRLGERERARAQLLRAGQLAAAHGLAHVQQEARQAIRCLDDASQQLGQARGGPRRAVCLHRQVADRTCHLFGHRRCQRVRLGVRVVQAAPGAVSRQPLPDMEVLLEVMVQWHVNERPPGGGQLHRGGQPALDHRKVAGGQVPVQVRDVAAHVQALRRRQGRGVDARPGHDDHPQPGDEAAGRGVSCRHPAQQAGPDARAADRDHADRLTGPVAELGAQRFPVAGAVRQAGDVPGEPEMALHPVPDQRQPVAERVRDHVARIADEHRPVAQAGEPGDLLDHLRVVVGGQRPLRRAAVGHRQPADEVGHPRVWRPLQLRVLVQEIVDVPALVGDPQVVRLVADQVVEDHEVRHQDLVHPAERLEHVQVMLARLGLDVRALARQRAGRRVYPLAALLQYPGNRRLGEPVDQQVRVPGPQLAGDRQVAAHMAEPDRRADVQHPLAPVAGPGPGARRRRRPRPQA